MGGLNKLYLSLEFQLLKPLADKPERIFTRSVDAKHVLRSPYC
jgi:hypothetical protein